MYLYDKKIIEKKYIKFLKNMIVMEVFTPKNGTRKHKIYATVIPNFSSSQAIAAILSYPEEFFLSFFNILLPPIQVSKKPNLI